MDGYHYTLVAYFSNTATKYSGVPDYPDLDDQPPHPWALHKDGCLDLLLVDVRDVRVNPGDVVVGVVFHGEHRWEHAVRKLDLHIILTRRMEARDAAVPATAVHPIKYHPHSAPHELLVHILRDLFFHHHFRSVGEFPLFEPRRTFLVNQSREGAPDPWCM